MARPAQLTCAGGHFVVDGERHSESIAGLGRVGVNVMLHTHLPDGVLDNYAVTLPLVRALAHAVLLFEPTEIVTMDESGLDEHPDHIAITNAAITVASYDRIPHLVRTFGDGDLVVDGSSSAKIAAIAAHQSQYDLVHNTADTYGRLAPYLQNGLHQETYRLRRA